MGWEGSGGVWGPTWQGPRLRPPAHSMSSLTLPCLGREGAATDPFPKGTPPDLHPHLLQVGRPGQWLCGAKPVSPGRSGLLLPAPSRGRASCRAPGAGGGKAVVAGGGEHGTQDSRQGRGTDARLRADPAGRPRTAPPRPGTGRGLARKRALCGCHCVKKRPPGLGGPESNRGALTWSRKSGHSGTMAT